jgi:hypothetical protein
MTENGGLNEVLRQRTDSRRDACSSTADGLLFDGGLGLRLTNSCSAEYDCSSTLYVFRFSFMREDLGMKMKIRLFCFTQKVKSCY